MDIKERFYQNLQEAREPWKKEGSWSKKMKSQQRKAEKELTPKAKAARDAAAERKLDEVSHALAKRAEHKAAKKYYDAYGQETDDRREAITKRTPEARKKAEKSGEKRKKAAKRVIRFQKYADKKKGK